MQLTRVGAVQETDGEQYENGRGTEGDVGRDVDVTEDSSAKGPGAVTVERHPRAHRKHAAAEQQVGDGQRQQEVVSRRAQLPVGADRDADEQVAADRDDDQRHEGKPNADRFRHAVTRRQTAYVTSGPVRHRRLRDVMRRSDDGSHVVTRDRKSPGKVLFSLYDATFQPVSHRVYHYVRN